MAGGLRGAAGRAGAAAPPPQEKCLRAFEASQVARGFSELTIGNGAGTLARFLAACGHPAWEMTREDVDRVIGELAAQGLAASTRRLYVQVFKNFHAFRAQGRRDRGGVRDPAGRPVDEFNAARHVGADSVRGCPRDSARFTTLPARDAHRALRRHGGGNQTLHRDTQSLRPTGEARGHEQTS